MPLPKRRESGTSVAISAHGMVILGAQSARRSGPPERVQGRNFTGTLAGAP